MSKKQTRSSILSMTVGAAAAALPPEATTAKQGSLRMVAPMAIIFALTVVLMQSAQAQGSYTVLHHFSGGLDGAGPVAGVTMDPSGNLYGTTYYGGTTGYGVAFKLTRKGSGYSFKVIHDFGNATDGASPDSKLTIGPDGGLYGVTEIGGQFYLGTVFKLKLRSTGSYKESLLYEFHGGSSGGHPDSAAPVFDQNGNIYGTTPGDFTQNFGVVYELKKQSGGGRKECVLYAFSGGNDGSIPRGGVIRDSAGNLYGVTYRGGVGDGGVIYQLVSTGSGWTEHVIHNFNSTSEGINPLAGLVFDPAGHLYGTTTFGGPLGGGTVFKLSHSSGGWTSTVIHSFPRQTQPYASLTMDAAGNLYGTTVKGGSSGYGSIFKLTRRSGGWTYTSLRNFTSDCTNGCYPESDVILDNSGNLYGTASGAHYHDGVVWKITP